MTEDEFKFKKDDRNKGKRSKLRHYKKVHGMPTPEHPIVIDVADSSDDSSFKRETTCNWARYDEDTEADFTENEQMRAADFELLQEHPSQPGGHFTFSSEKEWENDVETSKTMNISYFNLNLSLLNAGLQTIPFYKRLEYGETLFPKYKIKEMDEQAERAEATYKGLLSGAEEEIRNKMLSALSGKSSAKSNSKPATPKPTENVPEPTVKVQDGKDEELDKLLSMTESDLSKLTTEEKSQENIQEVDLENGEKTETGVVEEKGDGVEVEAGNKGDIQEWLDGLLDD